MKVKFKIGIPTIIYCVFAFIIIAMRLIEISSMIANMLIALVGLFALAYSCIRKGLHKKLKTLCLFGVLFSGCMIVSTLYNGNANWSNLLWIWSYMGIAVLIYKFYIPEAVLFRVALLVDIFFLILAISGYNAADVLVSVSQNNISVYVLFFTLVSFIKSKYSTRQYILAILAMVISVWTSSRAGILASIVLLVSIFFYDMLCVKGKPIKTLIKWVFVGGVAIGIVVYFADEFLYDLMIKMDRYGNSSARTFIWLEYLKGASDSLENFIFGLNTVDESYPWLSRYKGNTHNAYLMLHSKFGLTGLLMVVGLHFKVISKTLRNRDFSILIMILTVFVRGFFDWTGFPGLYDVFMWYLLLYCLDRNVACRKEK